MKNSLIASLSHFIQGAEREHIREKIYYQPRLFSLFSFLKKKKKEIFQLLLKQIESTKSLDVLNYV